MLSRFTRDTFSELFEPNADDDAGEGSEAELPSSSQVTLAHIYCIAHKFAIAQVCYCPTQATSNIQLFSMSSNLMMAIAASLTLTHAWSDDGWDAVTQLLTHYSNLTDCPECNCPGCSGFAFTAGDAAGRKFSFSKGKIHTSKLLPMASASKFPAATAIAGAVADGHLSFDTRVADVFPWWTADTTDKRSAVTLRHLLSFTSGFYSDDANVGEADVPCLTSLTGTILYTPEECAKQICAQHAAQSPDGGSVEPCPMRHARSEPRK